MSERRARVSLDGVRVGFLTEGADGEVTFAYAPDWLAQTHARPVSLTLPLTAEPYVTRGLHPFFLNLLPEGRLLQLSVSALKVSKDDAFGLLTALCADCIGDVEVHPESWGADG